MNLPFVPPSDIQIPQVRVAKTRPVSFVTYHA